jgi:hypothetical protein
MCMLQYDSEQKCNLSVAYQIATQIMRLPLQIRYVPTYIPVFKVPSNEEANLERDFKNRRVKNSQKQPCLC